MKSKLLLAPKPAGELLADFICSPVSMRGDRFFATVGELFGLQRQPPQSVADRLRFLTRSDIGITGDDAEEPMPWEKPLYSIAHGIATVDVRGALVKGYDDFTCWWYGLMSTDRLQGAVAELRARTDVGAVIFRMNTPGGVSIGMPETARQIVELGADKLTISVNSDVAASNGCRLAVACDVVLTTPSAVNGCIGTYIALYDYAKMLEEMGIKLELFRAGSLKAIGLPGKEMTDAERAFLQSTVDRCNKNFTNFVRERRGAVEDSTMQGQWFDGEQAVALGLADAVIQTESEVLDYIRGAL